MYIHAQKFRDLILCKNYKIVKFYQIIQMLKG